MDIKDVRIIFMGSPAFAVPSLYILLENRFNVVAVITSPDKPAGRGLKVKQSELKLSLAAKEIPILEPVNLDDPEFQQDLADLKPELQIIVGFRKLPEEIWSIPKYGTFNLHASYLPHYRGAAPINWAIMNGEKETGVTTFFINEEIDTGKIIFRERVEIEDDENAGSLHDKLAEIGAGLVLKTAHAIIEGNVQKTDQMDLLEGTSGELKKAPKIFKEDCRINWNSDPRKVNNFIRGLSPYPTAWTRLIATTEKKMAVKIFSSKIESREHNQSPGTQVSDQKSFLKIAVPGGYVHILELQLEGKKRMGITDFLCGVRIGDYRIEESNLTD